MAFWSDKGTEIKRSYRWLGFVHLLEDDPVATRRGAREIFNSPVTVGNTIPPFLIKSFTKPTYSVPVNELGGVDPKTNILKIKSGTPKWQPVTITAIDAENSKSNVTKIFYQWMERSGYKPDSDGEFSKISNLISKLGSGQYIQISLNQIDSYGKIFERWELINPILSEFDFGSALDYSNDQLVTVTMKFAISSAKYTFIREPQTGPILPFDLINPF